jgi:hypothetical protein
MQYGAKKEVSMVDKRLSLKEAIADMCVMTCR